MKIARAFSQTMRVKLAALLIFTGLLVLLNSCNPQAITGAPDAGNTALRTNSVVTATGETVVLDCEDDLPLSSFPASVLDAVAAAYPGFFIHEGKVCASASGTFYLFELYPSTPGAEDIKVVFDGSGVEYTLIDDDHSGSGSGSGGDDCDDDDEDDSSGSGSGDDDDEDDDDEDEDEG
jgi:hypothetical protein